MAANPLALAQRRASKDNQELALLFARYIGTREHPRGRILTAYRNTRRAMATALKAPAYQRSMEATEVLGGLQRELYQIGNEALAAGTELGRESARVQVLAYAQDDPALTQGVGGYANVSPLLGGWEAGARAQLTVVELLIRTGVDPALILGDAGRVGLLSPAPVGREAANWLALAVQLGFTAYLWGRDERWRERLPFRKQAVAAIDHKTTDCCLRVHGQVQAFQGKFKLTGTPRYADELDWSPFHWWCRTSVALYLVRYDDGLTAQMQGASAAELTARAETGRRQRVWPSHARSRR